MKHSKNQIRSKNKRSKFVWVILLRSFCLYMRSKGPFCSQRPPAHCRQTPAKNTTPARGSEATTHNICLHHRYIACWRPSDQSQHRYESRKVFNQWLQSFNMILLFLISITVIAPKQHLLSKFIAMFRVTVANLTWRKFLEAALFVDSQLLNRVNEDEL